MGSPNLGTLELVEVRKVWNHEERDFTPWLADNLPRLNAVLDMNLELVATEDRKQEAGRADILAKDTGSGANVVIENQLGWSDDNHLARLLGYAASRDAKVVMKAYPVVSLLPCVWRLKERNFCSDKCRVRHHRLALRKTRKSAPGRTPVGTG